MQPHSHEPRKEPEADTKRARQLEHTRWLVLVIVVLVVLLALALMKGSPA